MVEASESDRLRSYRGDTASTVDAGSHAPLLQAARPNTPDTAPSTLSQPHHLVVQPSSLTAYVAEDNAEHEKLGISAASAVMPAGGDGLSSSSDLTELLTHAEPVQSHGETPSSGSNLFSGTISSLSQGDVSFTSHRLPTDYWTVISMYSTDDEVLLPPPAYSRT